MFVHLHILISYESQREFSFVVASSSSLAVTVAAFAFASSSSPPLTALFRYLISTFPEGCCSTTVITIIYSSLFFPEMLDYIVDEKAHIAVEELRREVQ
jgi:hypothetical protein